MRCFFMQGLPKLLLLDRLSDIAAPAAQLVRSQLFHDRLRIELDAVEGVDTAGGLAFAEVRSQLWPASVAVPLDDLR